MKKISITLLTLLCATMINGCNSGEKITGTEAAKLLLAEERLDSESLKETKINFDEGTQVKNVKAAAKINARKVLTKNVEKKEAKSSSDDPEAKVSKNGTTYTWTDFEEYSNSISYFEGFVSSIEKQAKDAGKLIDTAKDKIDSNNVWVSSLLYDCLLQVTANEDLVMQKNNKSYLIVSRTLDEQGVPSYDSFTGDIGEQYGLRIKKVGDYRYEYAYVTEDLSFEHYFIADKSRGYWVVQSPINNSVFSTTIIKNDMCYEFDTDFETQQISRIKIMTADRNCDILTISENTIDLYGCAFTNIESVTIDVADDKVINLEDYDIEDDDIAQGKYELLYDKSSNTYFTTGTKSPEFNLENGMTLKPDNKYANGNVTFNMGYVYGIGSGMLPEFTLSVEGTTLNDKLANLKTFIDETGLIFVRDYDEVINSIKMAFEDAPTSLTSMTWNGIALDSIEAYQKAREIELNKLPVFVEKFNGVKDNMVLSRNQQGKLDRNTKFPYITNSSFNADYSENIVNINSATARVSEFTLFETGQKYNMQYALAQYDDENEGYFDLIPIETHNPAYITYNGEEQLTLTTNNVSFALSVPAEGTYELVTYIANEEGIRVTRPQPVKVDIVESNEISIHNYTAQIEKTDEGFLGITSTINNDVVLQINDPEDSYSYTQLYRLLSTEAYQYGVLSGNVVEVLTPNNTWKKLTGTETNLQSGTYRLMFLNKNNEQVYVSTTF